MGRKKQFERHVNLSLSAEMLARVDASLADGEVRLDLIRTAIERELNRRNSPSNSSEVSTYPRKYKKGY